MDTLKFREAFLRDIATRELGDTVLMAVMNAFDAVAKGPEARASDLIESLVKRDDTAYVLYGRFTDVSRFRGSAGLDGHNVGYIASGQNAHFMPKKQASDPLSHIRKVTSFIHNEQLWGRVRDQGLISHDVDDHSAAIVAYTAQNNETSGIALIVNDRTIDTRRGSHTDFHILGSNEIISDVFEVAKEYPQVMIDALRTVFPNVNVLNSQPINVTSHTVVDYRA